MSSLVDKLLKSLEKSLEKEDWRGYGVGFTSAAPKGEEFKRGKSSKVAANPFTTPGQVKTCTSVVER